MTEARCTAVAHSNIALIKYWGKKDEERNLPAVPSLSLTLDQLASKTTVRFDAQWPTDTVTLDGEQAQGRERQRVVDMLDRVRELAGRSERAHVTSSNDFPTAAGLASSASGFGALAVAARVAAGLILGSAELSSLARQSSASAARSLFGGFATLGAGAESAEPLADPLHWGLRLLVLVTERGKKAIGSTQAMRLTERTSPYYRSWVDGAQELFDAARVAVLDKSLPQLGEAMERSTLMMHASMFAARPAIIYLKPTTLAVIAKVEQLRAEGLECYFTMDAGPHVKVLVEPERAEQLERELGSVPSVVKTILCGTGPAASVTAPAASLEGP
jgi:diphosphomevalonate decarboxylase